EWYREIDPELAESFLEEVYRSIELARATPEHHSRIHREYRRVLCERFPFKVVFEIVEAAQAVHILAVTHTSRHPDWWKRRIQGDFRHS
ncbi:MAG: hypothetical protein KDM91_06450, partial [Verrucomicrobiae bacterium]|nr:hypothetical protein [Verrucomicrobiae bacterium]